jgi:glycosyltransferase involved in cell wall biosynthesis
MRVDAVIPALNEEASLPRVLSALRGRGFRQIVVVDNGSDDATYAVARDGGATPLFERRRGYGQACLRAIDHLAGDPPDVVVFLDADGADDPDDLPALLAPIEAGAADLVIGSRVRGEREPGALLPQARFGNLLACALLRRLYGVEFTDLGPFRAITWAALDRLQMSDTGMGWTVEMQARAARLALRCAEVPVRYRRRRAGQSKVAGNLKGSVKAGAKILWTIGREAAR